MSIKIADDRHLTGTLWNGDVVVASEQSLPSQEEFAVIAPGGASSNARVAGRDPGSNLVVLRLAQTLSPPAIVPAEAKVGTLAFAYGADGTGGATARMGIVNLAGPEWLSSAGGRIDKRVVLDMRLAAAEEGGPVFDVAGACLGITAFGPRRQVLVIPTTTVNRMVPALLRDGRVARGWLGVALQPVAVPDALQEQAGQASGLMVMSLAEGGPAAKAGILAGDIVVTLNGLPAKRFRTFAKQLGTESIGSKAALRVIRGGSIVSVEATVEARRPG
ncbi:MAG TPA: S1C family serine protease [Casimicrobiaceae bacterium]|nr:S1C family serine protease [Casimicrobiaceae bacterium]